MADNAQPETTDDATFLECQYRIADAAYDYWMVRSPIGQSHDLWYWHFARIFISSMVQQGRKAV